MTGSSFSDLFDRSFFFGYANPGADGVDEAIRVIQDELEKAAGGGSRKRNSSGRSGGRRARS